MFDKFPKRIISFITATVLTMSNITSVYAEETTTDINTETSVSTDTTVSETESTTEPTTETEPAT